LLMALKDNITKFENANGKIKVPDGSTGPIIPLNFGGPTAQA
jgi:hypothetical protein